MEIAAEIAAEITAKIKHHTMDQHHLYLSQQYYWTSAAELKGYTADQHLGCSEIQIKAVENCEDSVELY